METQIDEPQDVNTQASGDVEEEAVQQAAQEAALPPGHFEIATSGTVKVGSAAGNTVKVTYTIDLGYDNVDAQEKFGAEAVRKNYLSGARVKAGGFARAQIEAGSSPETIKTFMENTWNPGYKPSGIVDPIAAGRDAIRRLSNEDLAAILAERGIEV